MERHSRLFYIFIPSSYRQCVMKTCFHSHNSSDFNVSLFSGIVTSKCLHLFWIATFNWLVYWNCDFQVSLFIWNFDFQVSRLYGIMTSKCPVYLELWLPSVLSIWNCELQVSLHTLMYDTYPSEQHFFLIGKWKGSYEITSQTRERKLAWNF